MCAYGMVGLWRYQLFGRTIQMWKSWRQTAEFGPGKPWLLNYFDQIRFFPVSHEELTEAWLALPHRVYPLMIEKTTYSFAVYLAAMATKQPQTDAFKTRQQVAFQAELQRW